MRYTWRLIECFAGSSRKYDTLDKRVMTESERDKAQRNVTNPAFVWVR